MISFVFLSCLYLYMYINYFIFINYIIVSLSRVHVHTRGLYLPAEMKGGERSKFRFVVFFPIETADAATVLCMYYAHLLLYSCTSFLFLLLLLSLNARPLALQQRHTKTSLKLLMLLQNSSWKIITILL